jgi:hypothetical protein
VSSLTDAIALLSCAICGKPVPLETAKFDENGSTVHEKCYVLKLTREARAEPKDHP